MPCLHTMPISSFENAALLWKSYKIQLAVLLLLVVLDQFVTPSLTSKICYVWQKFFVNFVFLYYLLNLSWISQGKVLKESRKALVLFFFASPVLLNKFGISVSSVWSPGLIEKLTTMKKLYNFGNIEPGWYFLDFALTSSLNQKNLNWKWELFTLLCCLSILH